MKDVFPLDDLEEIKMFLGGDKSYKNTPSSMRPGGLRSFRMNQLPTVTVEK